MQDWSQQIMCVSQEKEENGHNKRWVDQVPFSQQSLSQTGAPHQHTRTQGQPLVVGYDLVSRVPDGRVDEDVEAGGDEDWSHEAEEEHQD